jgi:hypothetical protein
MTDPTRIIVFGIVTVMILGVAPLVVIDVIAISVPGVS